MRLLKNKTLRILILLISVSPLFARTAEDWLKRLDSQMYLKSAEYSATMLIHNPNGSERTFGFKGKVVGDENALMTFTAPPRQKGTSYLKNGKSLWIYFPRQDRTMQIQGHMLRQGVQGGDMSFEDMTESQEMLEQYEVSIQAETDSTVELYLASRDMTVSYPFREITLDKSSSVPMSILNRDASGNGIKQITTLETRRFGERIFPVKTEIRSLLVDNKWTVFEVKNITFDVKFDENTFTKRALEK